MDNLDDAYLGVLSEYSGSVNDRRKVYLMDYLNYVSNTSLNDLEWAVLQKLGYKNSLTDAWLDHLKGLGGMTLSDKGGLLSSTFYGYSPSRLFLNNEVGVYYDPSDLTTLFQDRAGTTPVTTAGQPVGLMLNKSNGLALGPQLVTNGDFSDGLTAWPQVAGNGSAVVTGGVLQITQSSSGTQTEFRQIVTVQVGRTYKVSVTLGGVTPTLFLGSAVGNAEYGNIGSTGSRIFTATTTILSLRAIPFSAIGSGGVATYDNISVTEISQGGNNATQATSVRCPTYRVSGNVAYIEDDLIDDTLNWTAPAGTYTVVFCDTTGNVTVQTNQVLTGSTDALRAQFLVGYIAVNRALTTAEIANLTSWLKAKAGL